MKEQWKSEKDAATLEEGLQQEKQEYISKLKYNTNCCKQWIRYIRLIFLFELTLFFGWGCYMILQSYHSQVTENEATDMTRGRLLPLVFESVPEVQKSTTEMPVIFVKPEVTDKLNNSLGIELEEPDLMPGKTIVIDVDSRMQTSTQNSISMPSNNMVEASDINNSPMTSPEDLVYDKGFMKIISLWKISPIGNIDKISTTNKNKEFINYKFFEKLQNIVTSIAINELENRNNFIENANRLMLNNQKDRALDTSNEIESLGLDVTTSLNLKDSVDLKISVRNSVQDPEQRLFDLIEDAVQDDHSEKSSSRDGTDEQVNASLESDLVICPPYQSYESSGMSLEHSSKSFSASQSASTPEFLKQIKNVPSDADIKNKDKHDADSNMSISASSDVSAFGSEEHFDIWIPTIVQKDHHSSEITANTKQEEEKYKLIKNIEPSFNFGFLQPEIPDIAESSTSNIVKFQWFNAPPIFANDLQTGSKDISESKKTQNPSDSSEDIIENMKIINSFIPEKDKSHNQCQIEGKMNVFRIKCPEIMFDKEWNLASFNTHTADILDVINFKDNFDLYTDDYNDYYDKDKSEQLKDELISNENTDKKVASLQHSVSKIIDAVELQGIIPDERTSENTLNFFFKKNSFDRTEVDKHDAVNSPDKRKEKQEISSSSTAISSFTESDSQSDTIDSNKKWNPFRRFPTQQQKQSKVTETQDFVNSENAETSLESNESIYALIKKLTSIFNDDMLNIVKQQNLSKSFSENDYSDYITQISWRQQYDDLKKILGNMRNHDNPYDIKDDYNYRKKRMADNLTEQPEQASNTLEEVNKNVKLLKNLKKVFQEMEILAACIDRLQERLLNNKLDDDYVSNEFSKLKYAENHT
ncbi:unnamed protein product [Lasius platythorax]|uniref:Uncharacterized protein n=1 Tax=Lasius platythorax TaxID=488582 RepID=A0AAV2N2B3_9HYME